MRDIIRLLSAHLFMTDAGWTYIGANSLITSYTSSVRGLHGDPGRQKFLCIIKHNTVISVNFDRMKDNKGWTLFILTVHIVMFVSVLIVWVCHLILKDYLLTFPIDVPRYYGGHIRPSLSPSELTPNGEEPNYDWHVRIFAPLFTTLDCFSIAPIVIPFYVLYIPV